MAAMSVILDGEDLSPGVGARAGQNGESAMGAVYLGFGIGMSLKGGREGGWCVGRQIDLTDRRWLGQRDR